MRIRIVFAGAGLVALALILGAAAPAKPPEPAHLLIANQKNHTIIFYDVAKATPIKTLDVQVGTSPASPHEVALSPDGKTAYVPIYSDVGVGRPGNDGSSIAIIDMTTMTQTGSIDLGRPVRPHRAMFGPDGLLYVTTELDKGISVIDVKTRKVVGLLPTGQDQTHMFVISPDGSRIYTTDINTGTVSVLDTKARKLVTSIKANEAGSIQRIAMTPDGSTVFTQPQGGGGGRGGGGAPPTGKIVMIDTKTNTVSGTIEIPTAAFTSAVTPDSKYLIASTVSGNPNNLYVIDLATKQVIKTLQTCTFAQTVYVSKSGTKAFIGCLNDGKLAVLDIPSWTLEPMVQLPVGIDGMVEY